MNVYDSIIKESDPLSTKIWVRYTSAKVALGDAMEEMDELKKLLKELKA
jgi:hypothetical protein